MVHSFHYAASAALVRLPKIGAVTADAVTAGHQAAEFWSLWTSSAFLKSYAAVCPPELLPREKTQLDQLLRVHLMEQAVYELQYELNNVPERAAVPLAGMLEVLET
jgi:maltose alpha-D-glucosyltransferase/alpha-amylase